MDTIEKANTACGTANISMKLAIRVLKAAIAEMKAMRDGGEVPDECISAVNAHIANLKSARDGIRASLQENKSSCKLLTDCLEDGGIIVPQDGGK